MAKKFNLKWYQKVSGDDHIERRLRDQHKDVKEQINEKQLEDYRTGVEEVVTEKLLENKRPGPKEVITEGRLNNDNSKFAIKYRNPEAYTGDINKLEEKRLLNDPVENEKYEDATNTQKQPKWWEGKKSPDGIKIADTLKKKAVEELDFSSPRWEDISEGEEGLLPEKDTAGEDDFDEPDEDFEIVEKSNEELKKEKSNAIVIVDSKKTLDPIPSIYLKIHFEPSVFKNENEIKAAILDKVIEEKPELAGMIELDNVNVTSFDQGTVRLIGEEYAKIIEPEEELKIEEPSAVKEPFQELSFEEKDVVGTPMFVGRVRVNTEVDEMNRDKVIRDVADFIETKHPEVKIGPDSLDLTKLDAGEVSFVIAKSPEAPPAEPPPPEALQEEFPVKEELPIGQASSDKKVIVSEDVKKNPKK